MFAYILQISIVVIIVALSAGYAGWRLHKSFTSPCHSGTGPDACCSDATPCSCCPECPLRNLENRKELCEKKKDDEKFGRMEKKH